MLIKMGAQMQTLKPKLVRAAFLQPINTWKSKEMTTDTTVKLFNSNVKIVLLCGSKPWRTTVTTNRIQTFINIDLRKNNPTQ